MSARNKHQTKLLTISAMLSALGVVVLAIGSVFQTLDLTTAALAAFFCIYAVIEIGGAYPWMVWGVTSFLGLLLLPQKSPAVFFLFIGCYPILKEKLERLSKALCLALKLAIFHAMAGLFLLTMRIFFPEELLFSLSWFYGFRKVAMIVMVIAEPFQSQPLCPQAGRSVRSGGRCARPSRSGTS